MKNVQISEELFFMLLQFHLLEDDLWQEEIKTELQKKLDAMVNHICIPNTKRLQQQQSRNRHGRNIWMGKDTSPIFGGEAIFLSARYRSVARSCTCQQAKTRGGFSMEDKRNTGLYFKLSAKELDLIQQKKALTGIRNTSAYLRKMAIDGYVINLDIKQLNEIARLLRITSNNINQMAKRANETGSIYETDVADVKHQLDSIKADFGEVMKSLSKLG